MKKIIKKLQSISNYDEVAIVTHDKADGDALSASWLIRSILMMNGSLYDKVDNYIHSYKQGDYLKNFDLQKVNPQSKIVKNQVGKNKHYKYVIMVDTNPTQDRVDIMKEISYDNLIIIDHHTHKGQNEICTEDIFISTSYFSCTEILWEIAFEILSDNQITKLLNQEHYMESTMGLFTDNGHFTYDNNYANTLRRLSILEEKSPINLTGKMMAMKNIKLFDTVKNTLSGMIENKLNVDEENNYLYIESNGWSSELKDIIVNIKEVEKVLVVYKNVTQKSLDSKINNFEDEPVGVFVRNALIDFDLRQWFEEININEYAHKVSGQSGIVKVWFKSSEDAKTVFDKYQTLTLKNKKES